MSKSSHFTFTTVMDRLYRIPLIIFFTDHVISCRVTDGVSFTKERSMVALKKDRVEEI